MSQKPEYASRSAQALPVMHCFVIYYCGAGLLSEEKLQLSKFLSFVFFLIGTHCFEYIVLKDVVLLWDSQH